MKRCIAMLLLLSLLLGGCSLKGLPGGEREEAAETTAEPTVPATIPEDGDPDDVTCKGSYTGEGDGTAAVATLGGETLTNDALAVWYWASVAAYRQGEYEQAPDFDRPLDTQPCPIDHSVNSWQQYFLKQALAAWHGAQALTLQGEEEGLPIEEAYQPIVENHEQYMTGMPATKYLYGYNKTYAPNSMHQAYLDAIPDALDALAGEKDYSSVFEMAKLAFGASREALEEAVTLYNWAYSYFTNLSYYVQPTQEELDSFLRESAGGYEEGQTYVTFRHILILPKAEDQTQAQWASDGTVTATEEQWETARVQAVSLLNGWQTARIVSEATFSELARKHSEDTGTNLDGGAYRRVSRGQLPQVLEDWCFDEGRQQGDTIVTSSEYGYHVLYFCGAESGAQLQAEEDLLRQRQREIIDAAREKYPIQVRYENIALPQGQGDVSWDELLYPDVAHERYPEAPLYLQQDYQTTMFGNFPIRSYGCGITTFAMLATYLTDEEYTPPEMCEAYGSYSFRSGTDGMLFNYEPSGLGFYLKEKTYDHRVAYQALEEGHVVVTLQHKGHWTKGGHYLLLEKAIEGERVQVRDSNIYNYFRVKDHAIDSHKWSTIPGAADGFWIFEKKVTTIPACTRCGDPESIIQALAPNDYICHKCQSALVRRESFLTQ